MDKHILEVYETWLSATYFDQATQAELKALAGNEAEIEDRFYTELEFGTGGLRGIIGAGTNRMNRYTVRRATQGLANYIRQFGEEACNRGVVIAYDSRHFSAEFSLEAACVLAANGIQAYVFPKLTPTPILSYGVRALKAIAGIVVTASHNPANYNGYKVYWEDGAQVASERAEAITEEIAKIRQYDQVYTLSQEEAGQTGLLHWVKPQLLEDYYEALQKQSLRPEAVAQAGAELKIVYTPLHGTGNQPVRHILEKIGFQQIYVVPEQEQPDPNFSTVTYPNPEEKEAFKLAIDQAKRLGAQLIVGTDPDCDRVGVVAQNSQGEFAVLTGNQTGALLVNYILGALREKGTLPEKGAVVKTIVTSEMGADIARAYGVAVFDTLTGFKYIGEKMNEFEATDSHTFLFGYEESYGYLAGTHARDKDGVVAAMLICEMAAYYHTQGMNLFQALEELYQSYGYYFEGIKSITLPGKAGVEKIRRLMDYLRENPPSQIGVEPVIALEDYLQKKAYDYVEGSERILPLPQTNALKFIVPQGGWFCLRPSGTEPKLKIYAGIKADTEAQGRQRLDSLLAAIEGLLP